MRLLLTAFFLETGAVLVLAPWSEFWDRNYFSALAPVLAAWIAHPYVRGAVTGVGIVSVVAALVEIGVLVSRRSSSAQVRRP